MLYSNEKRIKKNALKLCSSFSLKWLQTGKTLFNVNDEAHKTLYLSLSDNDKFYKLTIASLIISEII